MKWTKDKVLTDSVWIIIKNKVKIRMQRLFFHNLPLHSILLSSEPSLSFGFCIDLHVHLSHKHILHHKVAHSTTCRLGRLPSIKADFRITSKFRALKLTGWWTDFSVKHSEYRKGVICCLVYVSAAEEDIYGSVQEKKTYFEKMAFRDICCIWNPQTQIDKLQ